MQTHGLGRRRAQQAQQHRREQQEAALRPLKSGGQADEPEHAARDQQQIGKAAALPDPQRFVLLLARGQNGGLGQIHTGLVFLLHFLALEQHQAQRALALLQLLACLDGGRGVLELYGLHVQTLFLILEPRGLFPLLAHLPPDHGPRVIELLFALGDLSSGLLQRGARLFDGGAALCQHGLRLRKLCLRGADHPADLAGDPLQLPQQRVGRAEGAPYLPAGGVVDGPRVLELLFAETVGTARGDRVPLGLGLRADLRKRHARRALCRAVDRGDQAVHLQDHVFRLGPDLIVGPLDLLHLPHVDRRHLHARPAEITRSAELREAVDRARVHGGDRVERGDHVLDGLRQRGRLVGGGQQTVVGGKRHLQPGVGVVALHQIRDAPGARGEALRVVQHARGGVVQRGDILQLLLAVVELRGLGFKGSGLLVELGQARFVLTLALGKGGVGLIHGVGAAADAALRGGIDGHLAAVPGDEPVMLVLVALIGLVRLLIGDASLQRRKGDSVLRRPVAQTRGVVQCAPPIPVCAAQPEQARQQHDQTEDRQHDRKYPCQRRMLQSRRLPCVLSELYRFSGVNPCIN